MPYYILRLDRDKFLIEKDEVWEKPVLGPLWMYKKVAWQHYTNHFASGNT